jgi:hypothetical protein
MTPSKPRNGSHGPAEKSVTGKMVMKGGTRKGAADLTVRFGSTIVSAASPNKVELRRNVNTGRAALARAATKIVKSGVSLPAAESVPLYRADPRDPARLIRELNGKTSLGVFVAGKFKVSTKR